MKTIGDPALSLLLFTRHYLYYLGSVLKIPLVEDFIKDRLQKNGELEKTYWKNTFRKMRGILSEQINLRESEHIFEALSMFKKKIHGRSVNRIPDKEAKTILGSLKKIFGRSRDNFADGEINYVLNKSIFIHNSVINIGDQQLPIRAQREGFQEIKKGTLRRQNTEKKPKSKTSRVKVIKKLKPFRSEEERFIDLENPLEYERQDFLNELETIFAVEKYKFADVLFDERVQDFLRDHKRLLKENDSQPILLEGESGAGKSFYAEKIHYLSYRQKKKYEQLNCADFKKNETMAQGDLFGWVQGAFTNAIKDKIGLLERLGRGSLCLENIENMPLDVQEKLLVFLEKGEFRRLGSEEITKSDVRLFITYVTDIEYLMSEGKFSDQLFYRIKGNKIRVLSLRERRDEIPNFLFLFITKYCRKYSTLITHLSKEVVKFAKEFSWPGNVRSLDKAIKKSVLNSMDKKISLKLFFSSLDSKEEIEEIWNTYGKSFRSLTEQQKEILYDGFGKKCNTQSIAGWFKVTKETANNWCKDLEEKGFLKFIKKAKKGGVKHYQARYPFLE